MTKNKRSLPDDSSSDEDVLLSDDERKTATGGGKKKKKPRRPQYDEARKKEIRETNKLAARECRARKKRLMSELEKTVGSLTAEHSALVKQNRELTIRLETLQRTVGPPPATAAATGGLMGSSMSSTTPQLATVANSATSLLSGLGGGGQQSAMNNSLMMPNAAQMALLAQLNANTNPGYQVSFVFRLFFPACLTSTLPYTNWHGVMLCCMHACMHACVHDTTVIYIPILHANNVSMWILLRSIPCSLLSRILYACRIPKCSLRCWPTTT